MPVTIGAKASSFSEPTGLMSDCHRRIEMFLRALQAVALAAGEPLDTEKQQALEVSLRYFREAAPKHNADEEESLFPRLRKIGEGDAAAALAEMERLEQEHRWAEPLHQEVDRIGQRWLREGRLAPEEASTFQSALTQLAKMYEAHIEFEDKTLFPLAQRLLPADQKAAIGEEMSRRRGVTKVPIE